MRPGSLTQLLAGLLCTFALSGTPGAVPPAASARLPPPATRQLSLSNKPWRGDFDAMLERRWIRVLVPYSRTLYFIDKGHEHGLTAELVRDFERYVNDTYGDRLGERPLTVVLIPTTRDKLLPDLNAGLGDIAAGNLTVTDERLKRVDFVASIEGSDVRELVLRPDLF